MGRRKAFDRFMVSNDNGHNLKLARLSDAEFRAVVQGVWPIASEATPRGAFMVGKLQATAEDVVFKAPKVSVKVAAAAIEKLRALGMLEFDENLGGEWVHDWDLVNPAPKSDNTNAERQRRWRERQKLERDGFKVGKTCAFCGTSEDLTIDHIEPTSAGGSAGADNWQVLCRACNASKGTGEAPKVRVSARGGTRYVTDITPPEVEGEVEGEEQQRPVEPSRLDVARAARERERRAGAEVRAGQRQEVFDTWKEVAGRTGQTVFSPERRRLIDRALDAYPFEDVLAAVKGWRNIPHNRGENATGTVYDELRLLLRDAEHIEKYRDAEVGARRVRASVARRYLTAAELKEIRDREEAA